MTETSTSGTCRNCEHTVEGNYCSYCGQKKDVPVFTFHHIFEEAFHAFTHADKSLLSFVRKLVLHPGRLAYEYIVERKRKQYFNPFTFFVLITALNAFVESLDIHLKDKLFNDNNTYGEMFNYYSKALSLITIPLVAFFIWLIHSRKPRLRYSEYTVFAMILMSLLSIIGIVVHSLNYGVTYLSHHRLDIDDSKPYALLVIAYIAYADYEFHRQTPRYSWLPSLLSAIFFFVVQAAILLFIIWAYINDFKGIGNFYMFGIRFGR